MPSRTLVVLVLFFASFLPPCLSTSSHSTSSEQSSSSKSIENRPYSKSGTAYSDTDSKESVSGRTTTPGSSDFHKGKYTLYNGKIAYHHEMSKHFQTKEPKFAKEHEDEMESAHARKMKHANWSAAIMEKKMEPGRKCKLPQPFPNPPPNAKEAKKMRKDRTITWNTEKGFNRLRAEKLPYEQKRPKREEESSSSSSSSNSYLSPANKPQSSKDAERSTKRTKHE